MCGMDDDVSAAELLEQIAMDVRACKACKLHQGAIKAVPGEGPANAKILFIGEAPGYNEDRQGRPFVGAAGQFLNELLGLAGLRREDVFIANVVKHRPPNNRDPEADEMSACAVFLERQIAALNPLIIVTLGRFSMARWFPGEKISRIHGQPKMVDGRMIVPMIHPAAALHQPQYRSQIEEDFRRLPQLLAQAQPQSAAPTTNVEPDEPEVQQLSMF